MKRIIAKVGIIVLILIPTTVSTLAPVPTVDTPRVKVTAVRTVGEYCITKQSTETIEERVSEYPKAETIWNYLRNLGLNGYVCAGIIGNVMVESGGHTLAIEPNAETKTFYGICQWSKKYYPDVIGVSLDAQCDYLRDTIQYELNTFGFLYAKNFDYEDFLLLEDESKAALAFAKCYERCSSDGYKLRQECATTAYKYFTKLEENLKSAPGPSSVEM